VLYEFDDQDFQNLAKYVRVFFENMRNMYVNKIIVDNFPLWMTQNWLYRQIIRKPLAGITETVPRFTEYILTKVKEHRATLDIANPKDFLDILLIAAEKDSRLGHFTITSSIVALYLGASDTLSNQMRWLCFTLADHPEVQEKMFDEINTSIKKDSEIIKENCPFTRSVLLENMRWHPVVDTLPHRATEDIEVQGVPIPNETVVQASLTAVMHDPKNFQEPEKFIPDRFVKNGIFVNDVKVCGFSLGLRNCIGKQLAIEEYFVFASNMVNSFRIVRTAGDISRIAEHSAILMPEGSRVRFVSRSCQ